MEKANEENGLIEEVACFFCKKHMGWCYPYDTEGTNNICDECFNNLEETKNKVREDIKFREK